MKLYEIAFHGNILLRIHSDDNISFVNSRIYVIYAVFIAFIKSEMYNFLFPRWKNAVFHVQYEHEEGQFYIVPEKGNHIFDPVCHDSHQCTSAQYLC